MSHIRRVLSYTLIPVSSRNDSGKEADLAGRNWHRTTAAMALLAAAAAASAVAAPRDAAGPQQQPRSAPPALPASGAQSEPIDLNEGKSAAEMFNSGCAVCHQKPQGLAKGRSAGQLSGFLRQHYTSGSQQAGTIAAYLTSGGLERGSPTPVRATPGSDEPPASARRPAARPGDIAAPEGASAQNRNRRPAPVDQNPDGVIFLAPGATEVPDDAGRRRDTPPAAAPAAPAAPAARPQRTRPTETARPAEATRPADAARAAEPEAPPATSAASPPAEEKPAAPPRDNIPL